MGQKYRLRKRKDGKAKGIATRKGSANRSVGSNKRKIVIKLKKK